MNIVSNHLLQNFVFDKLKQSWCWLLHNFIF